MLRMNGRLRRIHQRRSQLVRCAALLQELENLQEVHEVKRFSNCLTRRIHQRRSQLVRCAALLQELENLQEVHEVKRFSN